MRKGENPTDVLDKIHDKVTELNTNILPKDVKIVPFYDRTNLMDLATETVLHNLAEGIILVTVIVMLFGRLANDDYRKHYYSACAAVRIYMHAHKGYDGKPAFHGCG